MNRFEIISKFHLTPYMTITGKEIVYRYTSPDGVFVDLTHFSRTFSFMIHDDDGNEIRSQEYTNFTDFEKYENRYNEFCKFFNVK